jgi:hypothetical protein
MVVLSDSFCLLILIFKKFRKIVEKLENTNKPYFSIILTDFNLTLDILKKNYRKSSKLR